VISATIEMPVQEFGKWFEKETANIVKPLDKEANTLIEDVKKRISQAKEDCDRLIKECEREIEKGKTFRRSRVAKRLATFFIDTLNKIVFSEQVSFGNTEVLLKDLKRAFSTIEREKSIWFPRISPMFIMARRKIEATLSRLFDAIDKLDSFTSEKYARVKSISNGLTIARTIVELQSELEKLEMEENETEASVASVNKAIEEAKQKILVIQQKDEMRELMEIDRQAHELNRSVKHELRYVQKPFIKLQNLYHSGDAIITKEETEKLNAYLANPFSALAMEEQGYPVLKRVLEKINESIEHEKLKLKGSRQRKAQDQIESLLKDALVSIQQHCKQVYTRREQLSTSGKIANFQDEVNALQTVIKEHELQMDHLNSKLANFERNIKEKKDKLERHRTELQKTVFDLTKKNIKLKVSFLS
jgi:DNA repair exonuclease SbcCD ATPase subunit